jgi:class 3 adenylate cyclase
MPSSDNKPKDDPKSKKEKSQQSEDKATNLSKFIIKNWSDNSSIYYPLGGSYSNVYVNSNTNWPIIAWPNEEITTKTKELYTDIEKLRKDVEDKAKALQQAEFSNAQKASDIEQLKEKINELSEKEKLGFLLTRVSEEAQKLLLENRDFQKSFIEGHECNTFVMSVDIRRSTELMSKARSPQQFARFMTSLCKDLEGIIKDSYGVFDKFTGDGILAFFPEFYSGEDAGYYVVTAAERCHATFQAKYKEFRSSFKSILTDVGLGIGIDHGPAHLVQIAGGLTVVGAPVVYACRMSGAPAGLTYLNQPGYEKISEQYSAYCFFEEREIEIKNEGDTLAYKIQLNGKEYVPKKPEWIGRNFGDVDT